MSHFYGTEFEILAGFGLIGSTENCPTKLLLATFDGNFFIVAFAGPRICTSKKLHKTNVRKT